jgi:hypothetical protein
MARRVILPSSVSGSGWTNPSNGLVSDGQFAALPAGAGVSLPLIFGGMIDGRLPDGDTVTGVEAILRLGHDAQIPSDGIDRSGLGFASHSLAGGSVQSPETWDGDTNTFFWSGSSATGVSISVVHDLLTAKAVNAARWSYSAQNSGVPALRWSNDGFTWDHVVWTPGGGPDPYAGGQTVRTEWVGFAEVTARYWMMQAASTQSFRIREFWLYKPATSGGGGPGPEEGEAGGPG